MASVQLYKTWVNLVSTGEAVSAYTGRGRAREKTVDGETRRLAGGRFRAVGTLGVRRVQSFMLRDVSLADTETLESWIGQTVIVRDNRGYKMFGTYWSVNYFDRMSPDYHDINLSITEVTYQEGTL